MNSTPFLSAARLGRLAAPAALLIDGTVPAWGHSGHEAAPSLLSALVHPFLGLDHLAVVLLVAWWSARQGRFGRIGVPIAFAGITTLGIALAGWALPGGASLSALALLGLGALVLNDRNPGRPMALALGALFAFLHGQAHGSAALLPWHMAEYGVGIGAASGIAVAMFTLAIRRIGPSRRSARAGTGSTPA